MEKTKDQSITTMLKKTNALLLAIGISLVLLFLLNLWVYFDEQRILVGGFNKMIGGMVGVIDLLRNMRVY